MVNFQQTYNQLTDFVKETGYLESACALLDWDQQTHLPSAGGEYRAEQLSYFAGEIHRRQTNARVMDWLNELSEAHELESASSTVKANIAVLKRDYEKKGKLPEDLVQAIAHASSVGQRRWVEAREQNNLDLLVPSLENIFNLKREHCDAIGYAESPYDVLIDDYEPGCTTRFIRTHFTAIEERLVQLLDSVLGAPAQIDTSPLSAEVAVDDQEKLSKIVTEAIGFDYKRGRLDESAHPFSTGLGPDDVRITTRYSQGSFKDSLFGSLHEAGHAIYEQGLRADQYGLPGGSYCSLGIHESQSRLWENLVGRSAGFVEYFYSLIQRHASGQLDAVPMDDFYRAINAVEPSLIRVEADQLTYNLHIVVRFELEADLIEGNMSVHDLRDAWNQKYQRYLGLIPDSDNTGVLQDIHWSAGLVGYFPTYTLGNMYASQIYSKAEDTLGELTTLFANGKYTDLTEWLNSNVHQQGRCLDANKLLESITGEAASSAPMLNYFQRKVAELYKV